MPPLRVVSIGVLAVSGRADEGTDIVSVIAGADVVVVSEPVVLVPLAQLVKAAVLNVNAAQTIAVVNSLLEFLMVLF